MDTVVDVRLPLHTLLESVPEQRLRGLPIEPQKHYLSYAPQDTITFVGKTFAHLTHHSLVRHTLYRLSLTPWHERVDGEGHHIICFEQECSIWLVAHPWRFVVRSTTRGTRAHPVFFVVSEATALHGYISDGLMNSVRCWLAYSDPDQRRHALERLSHEQAT